MAIDTLNNPMVNTSLGTNPNYNIFIGKLGDKTYSVDSTNREQFVKSGGVLTTGDASSLSQWMPQKNKVEEKKQTPTVITSSDANSQVTDWNQFLKNAQDQYKSSYEATQQRIAQEQAAQEAIIRAQYQAKQEALKAQQEQESASQSALEFRLGRKDTLFGQGEMNELTNKHNTQMNELLAQQDDSIQKMKSAVANDDWKAYQIAQDSYNQAFNQALNLSQETRAEKAAELKNIQDKNTYTLDTLDKWASSGITPTDIQLQEFDKVLGGEGIAKQYFDSAKSKADTENQAVQATQISKILDTIPEGTKITIGGREYFGTQKNGNIIKTEYDPKTGISTSLTYDVNGKLINSEQKKIQNSSTNTPKNTPVPYAYTKAQQQKLEASLGKDWKSVPRNQQLEVLYPKQFVDSVSINQATQIKQNLASQKGGDGYVSPNDYAMAKSDWIRAGGSTEGFENEMEYLKNPKNNYYK